MKNYCIILLLIVVYFCILPLARRHIIGSEITYECFGVDYFLPNSFTPNYYGKNELFLGKGALENLFDFSMSIRNRYGELVFYSENPYLGCDGSKLNSSVLVPQGGYIYAVNYRTTRGQLRKESGTLTLVR